MCGNRYNGPKPVDMLPVGTKAKIVIYDPGIIDQVDYQVFEGTITNHFVNNVAWNYGFSERVNLRKKINGVGGGILGTYKHKNHGKISETISPFLELINKYLKVAGEKVYSLYINDWGATHTFPGIQYICILTTLPKDEAIKTLRSIVDAYKVDQYNLQLEKIKKVYT